MKLLPDIVVVKFFPVRFVKFFAVTALLVFSTPEKGRAIELGLTPSQVFTLWESIHLVVDDIVRGPTIDQNTLAEIDQLRPRVFAGKTPSDVYREAGAVQEQLNHVLGLNIRQSTPGWIAQYELLGGDRKDDKVTPSMVFVLSSQILGSLVEKYIETTNGSRPINGFFEFQSVPGRTPSDVFALVDLLRRKLGKLATPIKGGSTDRKEKS